MDGVDWFVCAAEAPKNEPEDAVRIAITTNTIDIMVSSFFRTRRFSQCLWRMDRATAAKHCYRGMIVSNSMEGAKLMSALNAKIRPLTETDGGRIPRASTAGAQGASDRVRAALRVS